MFEDLNSSLITYSIGNKGGTIASVNILKCLGLSCLETLLCASQPYRHCMVEASGLDVLASAGLRQVRRLRELESVLYDSSCLGHLDSELPVYETYRDCCDDEARDLLRKYGLQYDVTVIPPLLLGEEYVKTLGHCHLRVGEVGSHSEVFEVLKGEAVFFLQKQRGADVDDVSLLFAREGEGQPSTF